MDSDEAHGQISESKALQVSLATTAQKHNAKLKDASGGEEAEPEAIAAMLNMETSAEVADNVDASAGNTQFGGGGDAPAYSEPQLQLSAPSGIAAATPASAIMHARTTSSVTAGQDINFASQANAFNSVGHGISLFTYGKASDAGKPNQETGIKLHSASGKVSIQSQTDETKITAANMVTVVSTTKSVTMAAPKHVQLTAMGALLRLEGGNIMIHGPGTIKFKASMKELTGPKIVPVQPLALPVPGELYLARTEEPHSLRFATRGNDRMLAQSGWAHQPFQIADSSGKILAEGHVGEDGRLPRVTAAQTETMVLRLGDLLGATLIATVAASIATQEFADDEADNELGDVEIAGDDDDNNDDDNAELAPVTKSRYFQEVAKASAYHASEFLSEAAIHDILDNADAA